MSGEPNPAQKGVAGADKAFWQHLADAGLGPDLLPTVCDQSVPISPTSTLTELGKVPSMIDLRGYAHGLPGWTCKVATAAEIEKWSNDNRLGICLQTRQLKVFDVDVEDQALAIQVEDVLRPMIADFAETTVDKVPLRFRENSTKFAIPVRCDLFLSKRTIELGGKNKIEFLGNGQQAMVAGTHPSGSRIEWEGELAKAPNLTGTQIDAVWSSLGQLGVASPLVSASSVTDDFMAGHEPRLGLSVPQMEDMLGYLDPSMGREPWLRIGMALKHETEGDDTGFEIWDEWSSQGDTYPGTEALRYQWESFKAAPGKRLVRMASVISMAKEAGYRHVASTHPQNLVAVEIASNLVGAPPTLPKWRQPALTSFRGFMADVVELALATSNKRQPAMTQLGVLVAMASACGSKSCLPDGMRLNLYGLSAAPTSSGKDHILHVCDAIARAAGVQRLGDFASGAGLEDALREGGMLASIDEIAHVLAARADRGAQHLKDAEKMLLKLFSAGSRDHLTRMKAGSVTRVVPNPALNLMGFAVPDKLGEALTDGDVASGLLNRMLIAVGDGSARPEPGPRKKFELDSVMLSKLHAVALSPGEIQFSTDAEQRVEDLKFELYEAEQRLPEEAPQRLLLGRTLEKALRISGVLAVFDVPAAPRIAIEHLDWAVTFVKASDATLVQFLDRHMHGGKAQADAAKVAQIAADVLRAPPPGGRPGETAALTAGYVPISVVARRSRLDARALNEAIDLLVMRGDLGRTLFEHTPAAGRPTKCAVLFFTSWG